jgi:hypothetical protein
MGANPVLRIVIVGTAVIVVLSASLAVSVLVFDRVGLTPFMAVGCVALFGAPFAIVRHVSETRAIHKWAQDRGEKLLRVRKLCCDYQRAGQPLEYVAYTQNQAGNNRRTRLQIDGRILGLLCRVTEK